MVIRKRWIAVAASMAALCVLALGTVGVAFAARNIPGVARLFRGDPPAPTANPIRGRNLADLLPTATLTPTPTPTEVPPSPTLTPSATATAGRPTDLPAMATPLPETPSPTLTATPRPQWIAFESQRGEYNDYEIMVMATNGSRLANLTRSWADDVAPAWSPDGKWIAFVSLRDTASGKAELEPGNLYLLPFDPVAGKATGEAVRLTDLPGAEGWPAWSPDGKKIAFHGDIDGNFDIWVMDVAPLEGGAGGTGLVNLTRDGAEDKFPAWSPDGKKIAFASMRTGNHDIWVMNADGSNPTNLTQHPARDRYPILVAQRQADDVQHRPRSQAGGVYDEQRWQRLEEYHQHTQVRRRVGGLVARWPAAVVVQRATTRQGHIHRRSANRQVDEHHQ